MSITKISPDVVDFDAGITITTADNLDTLTLTSTDADANAGPNLRMYRNSSSPADADVLGVIDYEGRNDNSQDVVYASITAQANDVSDGSEDGSYYLSTMVGGTLRNRMNVLESETVFNQESLDLDFRVDSDNSANALFVQGSDGKVGINIAAPARRLLEIQDASPGIVLHDSDVTNLTHEIVGGGNAGLEISADYQNVGTGYIRFDVGGSERARILESGNFNIEDGNLVVASGHGIDFSANSHATGMTSELLDSYEEGSWSPAISSGTATFSNARYTKIGRLVRFSYQVQGMDDITSNNHILVTGLPFPVQAGEAAGVAFGTYTDNASANVVYATDSETVYLYSMSSGTWDTMLHSELNSNGNYQYVAGTYQAES